MYADNMTVSMRFAIDETYRRRAIQEAYNTAHGIKPEGIKKAIKDITDRVRMIAEDSSPYKTGRDLPKDELVRLIMDLEKRMKQASKDLEFEKAAALRDQVLDLRKVMALDSDAHMTDRGSKAGASAASMPFPTYEPRAPVPAASGGPDGRPMAGRSRPQGKRKGY